ncbi:MAG: exonuclease sbcCD subunit D [Desulfobulbus propionicus]|nr:MAG: exonuclease sbcCD subunit D [Desulfobulbus propionicus]
MRILHTSDWHLGRSLYGRKRYEEFTAFLDWLAQTIEDEQVDILLVAGDVFDTSTPSNRAQELYYRFLCRVASSCCRHVVVIAGNHDSPSFLNAPKELLRSLKVYVVGSMTAALDDEILVLSTDGKAEAIICAVPYLRDKELRTVEPGETIDAKNRKLVEGVKAHYAGVVELAEQQRDSIMQQLHFKDQQAAIPLIAMGHLFTSGGKTVDGDGVRELYVGSLVHLGLDVFPPSIDYIALGHLHVPQAVGGADHIRYSGSPIPMGYGEAGQQKSVVIADFDDGVSEVSEGEKGNNQTPQIQLLPVPCFQELIRIAGSLEEIQARITALKKGGSAAWLEVEYTGNDVVGNLREILDEAIADSAMEIRRIKNRYIMDRVINRITEEETLDDLDAGEVFIRFLDAFEVADEDRQELMISYNEILKSLHEEDVNDC